MSVDTAEAEGELRDALARLLREHCDIEQVRTIAAAPGGWDRRLWSELSAMGVVGLAAPPEHGGEGAGLPGWGAPRGRIFSSPNASTLSFIVTPASVPAT
ncbi:acyl-CoA dehydrogenase family protein, partial [Frankia sp. AiPs1]|uniref:acyl-CoA dehydrogenase family protein n=1 Tax=Frankia sp. AiPs1 TaxID=573493 RepID=UPI0020438EA7